MATAEEAQRTWEPNALLIITRASLERLADRPVPGGGHRSAGQGAMRGGGPCSVTTRSSGRDAPSARRADGAGGGRRQEPELLVHGPMVVPRYWANPDATRATMGDGWMRTGDLARVDADGYVTIVDRLKDMINRGGEKIYCVEVEDVLCGHPDVLEAAVVGVSDPVYGEAVKA
jgi:acyl-CoA synthetase (AMP-forming)/AMP-acid ligase II